jgi:pheromone shutdown protein TraB|tara:strand:- start:1951 stop:2145 length:195 start_codon:yes stop_codon:yes gene_type:complete
LYRFSIYTIQANLTRKFATCRGLELGQVLAEAIDLATQTTIPVENDGFQRAHTLGQIRDLIGIW